MRCLRSTARRFGRWGYGRVREFRRRARLLATDRTARPLVGYLLAMGMGTASVVGYVVGGAGRPSGVETALLLGSLVVVMITLLTLGGGRPAER